MSSLDSFRSSAEALTNLAKNAANRSDVGVFVDTLTMWITSLVTDVRRPSPEFVNGALTNMKIVLHNIAKCASVDVLEVLHSAFGSDLELLNDMNFNQISTEVRAAFLKPNQRVADDMRVVMNNIKLDITSDSFRVNYQKMLALFKEHDEVAEAGRQLTDREKLTTALRALGHQFMIQFIMNCAFTGREESFAILKVV